MVMSWRRVFKSLQAVVAHGLLLSFTFFLGLKLCRAVNYNYSWWLIFSPLWLFHAVVARGRFSLPAPSMPHGRNWAPFHAIVATPLLVAFELLLCVHLERRYDLNLKIVFLPLLALEITILVDNIRMCRALMPGDDECITDEAIWETLPHFWVAISMVFFIAATTFTLLKLCGDVAALGWWDLFINYGVAECFAFLICTKWYNPAIHRGSRLTRAGSSSTSIRYLSSSTSIRYLSSSSSMMAFSDDDQQNTVCSLQDIGGHVMKIPFVVFQLMLFMHLEGTPTGAKRIPIPVLFSPLLLLQGVGFLIAIFRFLEKIILLVHHEGDTGSQFIASQSALDYFDFLHRGSRFLGWWSIDEGSREEQAQLYCAGESGYNTFSSDTVKKMPKADLANEIWRLQEALAEQTEISKISQDEFERLQNEKILCRICFGEHINVVLLPCRHHVLCRPSWLVDSNRIATKIRSASGASDPGKVNWQSNPSKSCPNCQYSIDNSDVENQWPGLPRGVKFDPSDQEIIFHLLAKVGVGNSKPHPFVDEFIPTVDEDDGICYTHPQYLPGVLQDGSASHFFHRAIKAYNTGTRKRRKIHDANIGDVRWHKTGRTKPVFLDGVQRGCKKIMVLYISPVRGGKAEKTNWVMHQYHLGTGEDEKEGEYVVSKVFYQQQQVKQSEKSEEVVHESIDVMVAKVDPVTPKSVTPEPPRTERRFSNIERGEESFVPSVQGNMEEEVETPSEQPKNQDHNTTENHGDQEEDKNGDEAVDDTKWWENESQFLLSSQQLVEGLSLCAEFLQSQSPNRDGNENGQGLNHKTLLSDYAHLGPEDLKKDLEECQGLVHDPLNPANIELDTPPDFRLSQLEFESQESYIAWGGNISGKAVD